MKSERKSIKTKLSISLALIIFISLVSAISFFALYNNFITKEVGIGYLNQRSQEAREKFNNQMKKYADNLILFKNWTKNGLIDIETNQNLELALIPVLNEASDFYALSIYTSRGYEYRIRKDASFYASRYSNLKDTSFFRKKIKLDGKVLNQWKSLNETNPALQQWILKDSIHDGTVRWYGPEYSNDYNQNLLTIHISWSDSTDSRITNYIGISFLTLDLLDLVNSLSEIPDIQCFLTNSDAELYTRKGKNKQAAMLVPFYKSTDPLKQNALKSWLDNGKPMQMPLSFDHENKRFWMDFIYLNDINQKAILAVIVPQKLFSDNIRQGNRKTFLFSFLFLILGLAVALFFILRYTRQLKIVPKHRLSFDNFSWKFKELIQLPENKLLEFKSTVRFNLKAEKNDKNIEFAWLKSVAAFMNTDGGNILIGVDDRGSIIGIEKDGFENDDRAMLHVKNLIQSTIGVEFSKFITIVAGQIESKLVLGISCDQSTKPAFLKNGSGESFYIRTGPASTKLTISQSVEYILNRGFKL